MCQPFGSSCLLVVWHCYKHWTICPVPIQMHKYPFLKLVYVYDTVDVVNGSVVSEGVEISFKRVLNTMVLSVQHGSWWACGWLCLPSLLLSDCPLLSSALTTVMHILLLSKLVCSPGLMWILMWVVSAVQYAGVTSSPELVIGWFESLGWHHFLSLWLASLQAWLKLVRVVNWQALESGLCSHVWPHILGTYPDVSIVGLAAIG